jgi:hypothetical protein
MLYLTFSSILSNDYFLSISLCLSIALFLGIKMCKRPNVKVFFETRISISFSLATDSVPLSFHSSVDTLRSKIWDIFWTEKSFFYRIPFQGKTLFLNPPWESDKVVESMNRTFKACRQWSRYFMPIIYREKTFLLVSKLFSLSIFMRIVPRLTLAK